MKKSTRRIVWWTLVVLIFAAIFGFSAQPAEASGELSEVVTGGLFGFFKGLFPALSVSDFSALVSFVRKLAHLFLFCSLSIAAFLAFCVDCPPRRSAVFAVLFCAVCGLFDELHQKFVPGRAALFTDVLIDTLGALIGVGLCLLVLRLVKKRKDRRSAD